MDIKKRVQGEIVELEIAGRVDAYWADHLSKEFTAAVREGSHHVVLDLSGVSYISSAGIRVFLSLYKQLVGIQGTISISKMSDQARSVFEMAGLADLFLLQPERKEALSPHSQARRIELEGCNFEIFPLQKDAVLKCAVIGDPALFPTCGYRPEHAKKVEFPSGAFGLGLGAFGNTYQECQSRFGEFLAVSGAATYLPTDSANVPDYMISAGKFVPEMMVLYALLCTGKFSDLVRFESTKEAGTVAVSALIEGLFNTKKSDALGIVVVAETSGLVGAALMKSPAIGPAGQSPLGYPEATEWLSFTAERAYPRSLSLIVGVLKRGENNALGPFLRPIDMRTRIDGHLHGAAFPYHPLKKGMLELDNTVSKLFESESILGILHLLNDDRTIGGAGQSELVRGACWIGPISQVTVT